MSATVIGKVDGRASVRCNSCRLIQFIAKACRKCHAKMDDSDAVPIAPAVVKLIQEAKYMTHQDLLVLLQMCEARVL